MVNNVQQFLFDVHQILSQKRRHCTVITNSQIKKTGCKFKKNHCKYKTEHYNLISYIIQKKSLINKTVTTKRNKLKYSIVQYWQVIMSLQKFPKPFLNLGIEQIYNKQPKAENAVPGYSETSKLN